MMLLALTTQVLATEILLRRGRFHAEIYHPGRPQPVEIQLRSKNSVSEKWHYHKDFRTYPRRPKTSEDGFRVLVTVPKTAGKYIQLCSVLNPKNHHRGSHRLLCRSKPVPMCSCPKSRR